MTTKSNINIYYYEYLFKTKKYTHENAHVIKMSPQQYSNDHAAIHLEGVVQKQA